MPSRNATVLCSLFSLPALGIEGRARSVAPGSSDEREGSACAATVFMAAIMDRAKQKAAMKAAVQFRLRRRINELFYLLGYLDTQPMGEIGRASCRERV